MRLGHIAMAAALAATTAAGVMSMAHAGTISFRIQAVVPVFCEAEVAGTGTTSGGLVQANLKQHCNTDHLLTVSVDPEIASRATTLRIVLDGDARSAVGLGSADFPQAARFNGLRQLSISTSGLSQRDSERLARSVTVSVQPI